VGLGQSALENLVMNPGFWKDKRVLVTGHTGFKGGWLCLWLQQLGAKVVGYSLEPPSRPSLFELAKVSEGMMSLHGDVRDLESMTTVMQKHRPEIVIHMAAQSLVRYSYGHPVETYATNVMGTVNVLEAARRSGGVRAILIVTSDKCYENREREQGYRENDPMGGHDPYSSSKGCAELVTAAYRNSYFKEPMDEHPKKNVPSPFMGEGQDGGELHRGFESSHPHPNPPPSRGRGLNQGFLDESGAPQRTVAIASARAGNVIGGGDWAEDRLLPDIVRAFTQRQPVAIRRADAVRPWQHVLEPLHGYMRLVEMLWNLGRACAEAWNFGPDESDAKPVSWIADRLASLWGEGAAWKRDSAPQAHEAGYLKLDSAKAKSRLGWRPALTLDQALEWSVAWYKAHRNREDMRRHTLDQIARYQSMVCL
jgi:CDP-glucose 4,6-dehydratase